MRPGRKRAIIDWERVQQLGHAHCSASAISRILGYDKVTLYRNIEFKFKVPASEYLHSLHDEGVALMREQIYLQGLNGNIIAQIFWLKNRDGWSDKQLVQHELLPPVQISLPPGTDEKEAKMIEAFFKTSTDEDNERIYTEPESLPERSAIDS